MSDPNLLAGITLFILFAWLGSLSIGLTARERDELPVQLRIFLAAITLRFVLSIVIYQFGLVNVLGDEDASGWVRGQELWQEWQRQNLAWWELPFTLLGAWEGHHRGYRYLVGALFYVTDMPYRVPVAALNGFIGSLTAVMAYRLARTLFSPWVAARVGWLCCLFPSMFIWSAQTVKEPVVIFLETVALYGCARLQQGGFSLRHLLLCIASIIAVVAFRFYAGYLVGGAVVAALIGRNLFQGRNAVITLLLVALAAPILGSVGGIGHQQEFQGFDLNRVQQFKKAVAKGGKKQGAASGVETADVRTGGGMVSGLTVGAAHLLLAPFPWQWGGGSMRMLLTLPELLYWWWLFFAGVVPGVRWCVRHRLADIGILLLFLLGFGLLYSLMFGNIGIVVRQRAQLLPWLFIFAAVGLEQRSLRRSRETEKPRNEEIISLRLPVSPSPRLPVSRSGGV